MVAIRPSYTPQQISVWLRGLLAIAWADGHFDPEEKTLITDLLHEELGSDADLTLDSHISVEELASVLGKDAHMAENFLRTAVMVALTDGVYSPSEDQILHEFGTALHIKTGVLEALRSTLQPLAQEQTIASDGSIHLSEEHHLALLAPVQEWLDHLEVHDPKVARFLCKLIPPQCPFERDVKLFGHKIVHIPPLCKLNPLYEQLVGLRFRALSYLADECGVDVTPYC